MQKPGVHAVRRLRIHAKETLISREIVSMRRMKPPSSRGVHNAGRLTFEVVVRYPYHPLTGQSVLVVGETEHGGALHLIVRKSDGAKLLLPAWMTFPESRGKILSCPRLSVNRLLDLRALLDRLMVSSSPHHHRARRRTKQ
jgi:hypothetical protein